MKCLIYCTKAKPYLVQGMAKPMHSKDLTNPFNFYWHLSNKKMALAFTPDYSGKIVAEFECDKVLEISNYGFARNSEISMKDILEKSCLTMVELNKYAPPQKEYKENDFIYGNHISNLKVLDKPLELSEVKIRHYPQFAGMVRNKTHYELKPLTKAPQNMCKVWYNGEEYILISIQPQYTCNILNGKQTIIVRKQILNALKELIK